MSSVARLGAVAVFCLTACGETNESSGWVAVPAAPTIVVVNAPGAAAPPAAVETSDVVIKNVAAQRCLDVPRQAKESRTMLWSWSCNGTLAQRWSLENDDGGGYRIVSRVSGKCLDVPYAASRENINLWQFDCNGSAAQRWDVEPTADGSVLIRSRASSLCVDVPHGQPDNGIGVQQYPCNGGAPQRWIVTRG